MPPWRQNRARLHRWRRTAEQRAAATVGRRRSRDVRPRRRASTEQGRAAAAAGFDGAGAHGCGGGASTEQGRTAAAAGSRRRWGTRGPQIPSKRQDLAASV
ncbi:hypothetical protein BRADI_1g66475v3 [Brachypodium distachyon]|uniref:Uncharacterized protein n=1 Tax=Brachypodium distachyon TaxID=15368 RepID=A0A0Q3HHU0_BRADI|nr:hypothetical protein BRADI_1g66475v3 [Brachypodium distachyon]